MSFGIPVIASDVGGLSEQIRNNITGILCKPNDSLDLYRKMKMTIDKDLTEICENALAYIESLDWTRLSNSIIKEIEYNNLDY